jgi:hypothetical protein
MAQYRRALPGRGFAEEDIHIVPVGRPRAGRALSGQGGTEANPAAAHMDVVTAKPGMAARSVHADRRERLFLRRGTLDNKQGVTILTAFCLKREARADARSDHRVQRRRRDRHATATDLASKNRAPVDAGTRSATTAVASSMKTGQP